MRSSVIIQFQSIGTPIISMQRRPVVEFCTSCGTRRRRTPLKTI